MGHSRGGMFVGGQLFHADDNGTLWISQLTEGAFGTRVATGYPVLHRP